MLDLWVFVLMAMFAIVGYYSGAVRQISHWIGLVAAYMLAKPAAALVGPAIAAWRNWPVPMTTTVLNAVLLPVIFIVASQLARLILNALEPGDERGPLDQGIGAVVGAGKAAAIIWALLCLAATLEKPLAKMHFDLDAKTRGSSAMDFARRHNIFDDEARPAIEKLLDEPAALKKIRSR